VRLNGVDGKVEPVLDLPVRHTLGRQARDPRFGPREGIGIVVAASLTTANTAEFLSGPNTDGLGSDRLSELERLRKWLARRKALATASKVHAVA
jgi:hypothetical protein